MVKEGQVWICRSRKHHLQFRRVVKVSVNNVVVAPAGGQGKGHRNKLYTLALGRFTSTHRLWEET